MDPGAGCDLFIFAWILILALAKAFSDESGS